jgi:tetratricopeptide (TPR) repeat protein
MNRSILALLLWLCIAARMVSATPLEQANRLHQSGDFAAAASAYEAILQQGGPRASVYYNLGNSYQSLKKYGPAILAYERARVIDPRAPDLLANLALARKAVAVVEDVTIHPWVHAVVHYLSRNEWSWIVAGAALTLGGLGLACGVVRLPRRFSFAAAILASLLLGLGAGVLYLRKGESTHGVVLSENAAVRISPFAKADSIGTAAQGRVVKMGVKRGDFQYVEVPGSSLQGWLAAKDLARVLSP